MARRQAADRLGVGTPPVGRAEQMSTWNGIGTKYLGFGHRNRDGTHYATRWAVLFDLPVLPLDRHRLTIGSTSYTPTGNGGRSVTRYTVHEQTALNSREIARTYFVWWLLGPVLAGGPPALLFLSVGSKDDTNLAAWAFLLVLAAAWVTGVLMIMNTYNRKQRGLPK
jgi:hypothetical protein